jgi:ribosomal protein S18 acetylase RimI-like enzyme
MTARGEDQTSIPALRIRRATADDLIQVVDLDARVTGQAKPDYWQDIFERYGARRLNERFFLVADRGDNPDVPKILGLIVGEVREWEFGSVPCGWVFAVSVDPENRQQRIGEQLFKEVSKEFKQAGVTKVRTMVRRQNPLHMSFFRSEGMMAGPYIQLEMNLDDVEQQSSNQN